MADEDYELNDLLGHLKKTKICDEPLNQLVEFASLLESMGEYQKSEQIYRQLLTRYKGDKRAESACHSGLAIIAQRMGHYDQALQHEQQCFQLQSEIMQPCHSNIVELAKAYNNLGLQHGSNGEIEIALQAFRMSNKLKYTVFKSPDHPLMADTYANIGNCYFEMQNLDLAEQNILKSMKIRQQYEKRTDHPDFIQPIMTLGNIYGEKKDYDKAIAQHKLALETARKTLPRNHLLLGRCAFNLAGDYKNKREYALAKKNYMEAYLICQHTMDEDHPEMQRLLAHLQEVDRHL